MRIVYPDGSTKIVNVSHKSYPESWGNSWVWHTIFQHNDFVHGIGCVYFNDDYPPKTLIVSNKFYNKYPDVYGVATKDIHINRFYVTPLNRKMGMGRDGFIHGGAFWKFLGYDPYYEMGNPLGDLVLSTFSQDEILPDKNKHFDGNPIIQSVKQMEKERPDLPNITFRDPCFPSIFFDKRLVSVEEKK